MNQVMNKTELIERTVLITGMTKRDTQETLDAAIRVIEDALVRGESISILRHWSLLVREKPAHFKQNPLTGEKFRVPEKKWVKFSGGKQLMKRMNPDYPYFDEPSSTSSTHPASPDEQ